MKTIYDRLNKVYDKTLLDQKDIRKHYRTICDLLEEYQIPHDGKSDDAVIQNEIVYESLLVKRQFEDVFFDTYVKMFDYWYDLNYLERKAQMNVDVELSLIHIYISAIRKSASSLNRNMRNAS